jgi:hypothetical protein
LEYFIFRHEIFKMSHRIIQQTCVEAPHVLRKRNRTQRDESINQVKDDSHLHFSNTTLVAGGRDMPFVQP